MRPRLLALSAIILAACGSQANHSIATPTAGPSHSASPLTGTTPSQVLFAVLETRRAGAHESEYAGSHDTIAIAGSDGYARAKTTFTPRSIPQIPMAGPVLQPEAYIAAGGVYFIDGTGVVHRLDASGAVRKVTTFSITSPQQAVSFTVSPDGKQLMAAVLTYPSVIPNPSPTNGGPPFAVSGSWMLDLEKAVDGGVATVVKHWQAQATDYPGTTNGIHNLVLAGWDSQGPLAMVDGYNGAQQVLVDGQHWAGGHLVRLSVDGAIGADQGPASCSVYWLDDHGNLICTTRNTAGSVQVATVDGHVLWLTQINSNTQGQPGGYALSPNGQRLAMNGQIANRSGSTVALPNNFLTRGWLDDGTIVGMLTSANNTLAVYHLGTSQLENWGFSGQFVGVLR